MSLRAVFTFPSRNLVAVIPCVICVALLCGLFVDTSPLKILILPVAMLTIFPAMIGFQPQELLELTDLRLMSVNLVLNFLALPLAALLIGKLFLGSWPELQAGLLIISVVPGGNMAVAFTMLFEGNVRASLKLSTLNLILGSLLAPLYLFFLAGTLVEIDILHIGRTIGLVVFIPLFAGVYTYKMLLKKISQKEFKEKIKPLLPAFSVWGLIYLLFTSISMKAEMFFSYPETIFQALSCLLLWYCSILTICVIIGRNFFSYKDAMSLLLNVELRNLPICIGIALTAFPPKTAMMIALAFLFQQQLVIWFWKVNKKYPIIKQAEFV